MSVQGTERVVRAACPHDCPDTCAMRVTVDGSGRATRVEGDPDHPVTAGFLCGKVSNYLDRVYSDDRVLDPLIRDGPKGTGSFRTATWDEALDVVARRVKRAIGLHGPETVLPYSYLGTMGFLQANVMRARFFNALGASEIVRTICADAGLAGVLVTHGVSPEVDPERWPHARYVLCWGWNPMSTAPHLWRLILEARRAGAKLVVVDPFRSRTARVADEHVRPLPGTDAALALGMMRAIVDAGLHDEPWCREHATGFDDLLGRLEEYPVERCSELCSVPAGTIARLGREFAATSARNGTWGRPSPTGRSRASPRWPDHGGTTEAAARTSPRPPRARSTAAGSRAPICAPVPHGGSTCRSWAGRSRTKTSHRP
jgi:anaerobic selenocysteine-containing dehydrogenase